ncbi:condensin subunit [Zopfochytrium polystomum]|nr:condensin subunit [Zopfochytrium polystomum]
MYIKEIILDGFKSYATKTVINGWSPQFNAITGLNGSGKSNILDAICFVLGITLLSSVRATNLADLVYKRGQAGITKASVCIIFNNEDRASSPPGWQDSKEIAVTRQVIVGGKNKYLVNGHVKTQAEVITLFHSVQLNVNNPHFLIMQGKVTKVLNMKPMEILAMIEEAAGTRIAMKTIEKKDTKLGEIQEIIQSEITPKLTNLKDKKRDLVEFQKLATEVEVLDRFLVACDYYASERTIVKVTEEHQKKKQELTELASQREEIESELAQMDEELTSALAKKKRNSTKFLPLESALKDATNEFTRLKATLESKRAALKDEAESLEAAKRNEKDIRGSLSESSKKLAALEGSFQAKKAAFEANRSLLSNKEELLQTLTTGMAATKGRENGYHDQLLNVKNDISELETRIQQSRMKRKMLEKELQPKEQEALKARKLNATLEKECEAKRLEQQKLKSDLDSLGEVPNLDEMKAKALDKRNILQRLQREMDQIENSVASYLFSYGDPTPGFDRSKVKGIVAELINLPENMQDRATALEVCAGGRLYNVVVESEVVATLLLKKGNLRKRVTMIPLNKIESKTIEPQRKQKALSLSPGKVDVALDIVRYDEAVSPAMKYVFGTNLICQDAETAKTVTFHNQVRLRSVTLDGDVYDPSGTLSGGSRPSTSSILLKIQQLRNLKEEYKEHARIERGVVDELKRVEEKSGRIQAAMKKLELVGHELRTMEQQLETNSNGQIIMTVNRIKQDIEDETKAEESAGGKLAAAKENLKAIERDIEELTTHREEKLKQLQVEIRKLKREVTEELPKFNAAQQEVQMVRLESVQCEQELEDCSSSIRETTKTLTAMQEDIAGHESNLRKAEATVQKCEMQLAEETKDLAAYDQSIRQLESACRERKSQLADLDLQQKQLTAALEKLRTEKLKATARLKEYEESQENAWIQDQKHLFGKEDGSYNFASRNVNEEKVRYVQMLEKQKKLGRNLDRNALEQFDRVERKEMSLKQKLNIVLKDKTKITTTIDALDKHKLEALTKTWTTVSKDFGSIFSDLLPGTTAKLCPSDGKDVRSGLEVKVNLGGVWKENLSELSGGQRSLVALSLILSLLQFKPAPMYILDEVDSALDESHTQNIGRLLRSRFKGSQFILVSLKDGMYSNANVLFRTKFREGMSTVERIATQP